MMELQFARQITVMLMIEITVYVSSHDHHLFSA